MNKPDIRPSDPLSQVIFIHDYVQLIFQDCTFSLFNRLLLTINGKVLSQGEAGFCDELVRLIDQHGKVTANEDSLTIRFDSGASLRIVKEQNPTGPEAWTFRREGDSLVVEQN